MDDCRYRMVDYLDEPNYILVLTIDEFMVLVGCLFVGISTNYLLTGMVSAFMLVTGLKRMKSRGGIPKVLGWLYWMVPAMLPNKRRFPASSQRIYVG